MVLMISFVKLAQPRNTRAEYLSEGTAYIKMVCGHVSHCLDCY